MRVLSVHNRYTQYGGEDRLFEVETSYLENSGHSIQKFEISNDDFLDLNLIDQARNTLWNSEIYRLFVNILENEKFDVVHCYNAFPYISPSLFWAANKVNTPVVYTLSNFRSICPMAQFLRDGRICEDCLGRAFAFPALRHRCYRGSLPATMGVATTNALHRFLGTWKSKVDRYIAPTEFLRQKYIEGGFVGDRIVVKSCGIAAIEAVAPGVPRQGGLFVGRLSREKGIPELIEATRLAGVRIRAAGDGPLAADAAASNLVVLGHQPPESISREMARASYFVMPSIWYEAFGIVIAEAFAHGLPVIAFRLGAMAELVEDGVTGMLVEPGDIAEFADRIRWADGNPGAMREMGARARTKYETSFHPGVTTASLVSIYESVRR